MMLNPWIHVWIQPKEVVRQQLERENREKYFIVFAVMIGMLVFLTRYEQNHVSVDMWRVLTISVLGGAILGPILFYLESWWVSVIGKWIGGEGTPSDLRVANMRGVILPSLVIILFQFIEMYIQGERYFVSQYALYEDGQIGLTQLYQGVEDTPVLTTLIFVASVWLLVLRFNAVGEAHGFSAWKALLVHIISIAIIALPLYLILTIL
ncbi:YIP1 family protein [Alkalicoccobacillus porphyridii]|uniref:Yip1 domain-containing protein n=1 Tax=Alkalicoccobacillus porphyridii TaxID=2597270 RepID=A0A554A1V1_9BACI|nr:YIP1 family protein [Alkalicoccobacillus porphyridii]TSB47670.1 hypothetical protein FN960_03895 [Alkalicoccobacillus porphyridii]